MNKLYVIGLGPGGAYGMTAAARAALEEAEVICGYTVYLDLIAPLTPGKELGSTPMTRRAKPAKRLGSAWYTYRAQLPHTAARPAPWATSNMPPSSCSS